jgi:hypothetical protein
MIAVAGIAVPKAPAVLAAALAFEVLLFGGAFAAWRCATDMVPLPHRICSIAVGALP